jgi:death-on-curing protein
MMDSIEFLELSDILEIHADQISLYGGTIELRDAGILESAIEQPRTTFSGQFLHAFPFEMAAAYLFHIVNNHPFVDGNKRTGTVAALVFLDWNHVEFDCQPGGLTDLTLAVATGSRTKKEIATFFQDRSSWNAT